KTVTVNERVPVQKTVTVNETHWKTVQVTEMRTKTVHKTVQVQQCVEVKGGLFGTGIGAGHHRSGGGLLGGLGHKKCNDPCADPCANACNTGCNNACSAPCPQ